MENQGKLIGYLEQTFGWRAEYEDAGFLKKKLTYALLSAAEYSIIRIEGIEMVGIMPIADDDFRWIKKLAVNTGKISGMPALLILNGLDSYQRRSLIDNRINFIVPGRQAYLPSIGIALNERGTAKRPDKEEYLSAIATAVIVHHLANSDTREVSISDMAEQLGYSVKSISLAMTELEGRNLVELKRKGQKKLIYFPTSDKTLWERAYPMMANPVGKRVYTNNSRLAAEIGVKASDSALSEISMLAEPQQETFAVYSRDPRIKELAINPDDGTTVIEIWKINPQLTASTGVVDLFSLVLSYKDDDDPRVNTELEKLLNKSLMN